MYNRKYPMITSFVYLSAGSDSDVSPGHFIDDKIENIRWNRGVLRKKSGTWTKKNQELNAFQLLFINLCWPVTQKLRFFYAINLRLIARKTLVFKKKFNRKKLSIIG